jgi:hypothetical protein
MSTLVAHPRSVNRMIPTSPDRADRLLPPHNPLGRGFDLDRRY